MNKKNQPPPLANPFIQTGLQAAARIMVQGYAIPLIAELNQRATGNGSDSYALSQRYGSRRKHGSV